MQNLSIQAVLKVFLFITIIGLASNPTNVVFAQESANEAIETTTHTIESGGPEVLNPVSNTADLNLLAGIFGKIARAAAGQIELSDVVIGNSQDSGENTDNVLSAIMFVYLGLILAITAGVIVLLIALITIQSGKEGALITERYNEWVAIRTIYALFGMMPVLGGWSIGQYAILSGTFFVNSTTNIMDKVSSRWVFAHGTTNSIDLDPYKYRNVIETVYLNEICSQIHNNRLHQYHTSVVNFLTVQKDRLASGNLSEAVSNGVSKSIEWMTLRSPEQTIRENSFSANVIENINNPLSMQIMWGSKKGGEDTCGRVSIDYSKYSADRGSRPTLINQYFAVHSRALKALSGKASEDISYVLEKVNSIKLQNLPLIEREQLIKAESAADARLSAFAFAFDDLADVNMHSLDVVYAEQVVKYLNDVSTQFKTIQKANANSFNKLLDELARAQRNGNPVNYNTAYTLEDAQLSPELLQVAGPEAQSLLMNTSRGWMFSGYKWWDLSKAQSSQLALQNHSPSVEPYTNFLAGVSDIALKDIHAFNDKYSAAKNSRSFNDYKMSVNGEEVQQDSFSVDYIQQLAAIGNPNESMSLAKLSFGNRLTQILTGTLLKDFHTTDLLSNLQNAGHSYLFIGEAILASCAALRILAVTLESGGGLGLKIATLGLIEVKAKTMQGILTEIAAFLSKIGIVFMIAGFIYAIYLPLLPAMIWTFGLIGWLEKLISLIIIFPIWMLGHVIPDGGNLVNGVGRQGYILSANVLLRPPVMVLSLHFAMAALGGVGFILGHIIAVFLPSSNSGFVTGVAVGLGSFVVLSGFMVVICHSILAWIYKIPDEIPHYIGGGGSNFGESESKSQIHGVVGMISSQYQGVASPVGSNGKKSDSERGGPKHTKQKVPKGSMAV